MLSVVSNKVTSCVDRFERLCQDRLSFELNSRATLQWLISPVFMRIPVSLNVAF